jgi:NAD(P)-dependent dehydrogenase (short-subunit alcohol dehydrogenase family)
LAQQLGGDGIRVNAIAPGVTESDATKQVVALYADGSAPSDLPIHTVGQREDLLGALLLLASDAGNWITGQVLNVDGGWVMRT